MKKNTTCSICERVMERGQEIVQLRCQCPDAYMHKSCALGWLSSNKTCPSCGRDPLLPQKRRHAMAVARHNDRRLIHLPWKSSALYQWLYTLRQDAPRSDTVYLLVYLALVISVVICILATKTLGQTIEADLQVHVFGAIDCVPVTDMLADALFSSVATAPVNTK